MKKNKKIIVIALVLCLLAALLIGGIVFLTGNRGEPAPAPVANWDTDWYNADEKEFLITTVEELYGLAELSKTYDFKGQTIKLGADIVINKGKADKWVDKAPEYLWNPIVGFAGKFDGQGYTISGVYGNSIVTSLGLFTDTQKSCVIKNLNLVNSCFKNNNDLGTGSIIGVGGGKLENIYSDAVLVSSGKHVGGLIGSVKTKGENEITNCWFDGTITMDGYDCSGVGGLVGAYNVEDAINTIAHCLSTADINSMGENVGGVCGYVGNGAFLNLSDSMYTGALEYDTNKYAVVGSVAGQVMGSASIIVNDTYTVDEIANRTIGTSGGYQKGNAIALNKDYLLGKAGYQWTTLDFENYWVAQKDGMPRLGYFTQASESIDGVEKMVDISWYDPTGATFEIANVQQLYGFAYLSRSYDFRGQTMKLVADITVNEGDASDWGKKAPAYNWTPIAWYGSSLSQRFKGTFDGQGHTISGIYAKGTENITSLGLFGEIYHGAVVKDFKLVNSYFEGVLDSSGRGPVGSVAGRLRGTIENVYSDAIVVNSSKNTGGIVGMITGTGQNKISGCWFDGKLTGITRSGGILGGVYGNKGNIEATIEHCLNTGEINIQIGQAGVGGICGTAETWSILYVDDCLNAGTYQTFGTGKTESKHVGTIVGTVTATDGVGSKAVVTDSYGVKEFFDRLVGWKHADEGVDWNSMMYVDADELVGYDGYKWTSLDFEDHWSVRSDACPVPVAFAPKKLSTAGVTRMVDYSWYDPDNTVHTIKNFQQLYGMARLWEVTNLFKDKTILLGADITINKGDAADWAEKAPAYVWEPAKFNGTFNGQGHTISGIYVKGGQEDNYVGLFHRIYQNGTVKNLKIKNSYIEGTMDSSKRGAVGSLAGRSNGIIDTVYSDAIVVNSARMTGGLVGMITGEGQNVIRNSWFDGQISAITRTGGILGGLYGNKQNIQVTIENCANTGDISVQIGQGDVGGICGIAETGGKLTVADCLNAGTYKTVGTDKEANTHIGSVFGSVTEKDGIASHVVLDNVYGVNDFYSKLVGWAYGEEGTTKAVAVMLDKATLTAENGYRYAQLDYIKAWGLNTENVPVPKAFATKVLDGDAISDMVDYDWYDPNSSEYIITTPEQLEAFAILCDAENDYFKGKTVKLGADITLNEGNAADWAAAAPEKVWTPIAFSGTFDGQGYTISGIYAKGAAEDNYVGFFSRIYQDGTVKNLKLTNSYFEGTMTSSDRGATGSLAGRSNGIIDTVYSDAIVVNSARMTGGLVGMITGEGENVIRNSWFDGQITAINRTGGILGGLYGNNQDIQVTIENCTNTGDISVQIGQGDVGGICGIAETGGKLTIADCLNAGTYKTVGTDKEANTHVGSVFGSVTEKDGVASHVVLDNVYGVNDFYPKLVGWKYGAECVTSSAAVLLDMETLTAEGGYRYAQLDYTNEFALNQEGIPVPMAFGVKTAAAVDPLDYSWFDPSQSEYIITTAAQLEAFNVLCNGENNYFSDKTVKLGADITLTGGSETAPNWTPITFSGIFDGQGHTISGIYVKTSAQYNGFFNTVNAGAVVRNLKLVNSRIEGTYDGVESRAGVGSIVGRNRGTVDTVYSNAIVVNSKAMTGGIAGMSEGGTITNCWFDGTIQGARAAGGILGGAYAKAATIEHCLNTGKVSVEDNTYYVGGICGEFQNASTATITDCLNAGTLEGSAAKSGTIVGRVDTKAALTVTNGYGISEFLESAIGDCTGTLNGSYAVRAVEAIQGYGAYQWTNLDFETKPYWVLKKDATPVLAAFAATDLSLEEAKNLPDYKWYDESSDVYVITTEQQLLAFNALCDEDTDYFNGKTVKLGADITLTGGSETAPNWTPVRLKGTFDGQGYTVSGVYIKTTEKVYTGFFDRIDASATVKNLRLEDSYIEGNGENARSGVGSIAGRNYGTIDTVYSNATLKNSKKMTGGIVGMSFGGTVTNCWFDGQINALGSTGGIIGGAYGQAATVEHCLNTGTITVGDGSEYVGGLYGYAEKASTLTVSDSLHAGTILKSAESDTVANVGMIIGGVDTDATLTVNDVYGAKAAATTDAKVLTGEAIGALKGTMTNSSKYAARALADIQGYGAYQWTSLDFEIKPYWVLKKDATPVLAAFDTSDLSLEEAKKLPDYSWYDENATEYVLSNVQQLLAFNSLCTTDNNYFKGKTIKLGADITLTGGSETTPNWTPQNFGGTFDGQGHTVSGVYVNSTKQYTGFFSTVNSGAIVKNLKLTNSYIEGNGSETRSGVGSIAGRNLGTIDTVYSDAIVKNSKQMTGGIVGMSTGATENTITNCWFDGQIIASGSTGGILGGTYAATATVEHCLNTGSITIETSGANLTAIGGLCGFAQSTGGITILDSLNAGTVTLDAKDGNTIKQVGTIIGAIHANATATKINDAYGIKEFSASAIGYGTVAEGSADYAVVGKDTIKGFDAYHAMTLDFEVEPYWVLMDGDLPGLAAFGEGTLSVADAKSQPDTSWYDAASDTYTINTTAQMRGYVKLLDEGVDFSQKTIVLGADTYELGSGEQLRAFAAVCEKNNFAGKTVILTANINLGGADNPWTPVAFGGTFDGQGYTISDLTVSLFNKLDGATVKNLKLTNSVAAEATNSTISNCILTNADAYILGTAGNGTKLEHCYSDGGLIADVQDTTEVKDSLAAGTPVNTAADGKLTMTDVYGIGDANASIAVGGAAYTVRKLDDILGFGAYQWTSLDFDGDTWVLKNEAIPALNVFDDTDLDLAYAKTLPDYTWYSETAENYVLTTARQLHGYVQLKDTIAEKTVTLGASEYTIATADQLLAFNDLCNADTDYFKGKTVQLGASITLNEGNAADWAAKAPANKWVPIAQFSGTFAGNGYTISGVYVSAKQTYVGFFRYVNSGAVVKNLKLVNSYIENTTTGTGRSGTGSIAGRLYGTVESVYSSAIVKNGALMTGGIAGMGEKGTIRNCWFDGTIYGTGSTGGILGGTYANTATLEHCLNTGYMIIETGGSNRTAIGGLCGYAQSTGGVTIRDSLNAGQVQLNPSGSNTIKQIGTIIGAIHANATSTTVANVYGATEFSNMLYGYGTAELESGTVCEMASVADYFGSGAAKLDFTTWWTARDGMIPMLTSFVQWAKSLGK